MILVENPFEHLTQVPRSNFAGIAKYLTPTPRKERIEYLLNCIVAALSSQHKLLGSRNPYTELMKLYVKRKIVRRCRKIAKDSGSRYLNQISFYTDFSYYIARSPKYPSLSCSIHYRPNSTTTLHLREVAQLISYSSIKVDSKQVEKDLHALCDHYNGIFISQSIESYYQQRISIQTNSSVILNDPELMLNAEHSVDLGNFLINISCSKNALNASATATPLQPNIRGGLPHPNVSGSGLICLGEGGTAFYNALRTGRILDAFLIVDSILHTYGGRSPYLRLDHWQPTIVTCSDCEGKVQKASAHRCKVCWYWLCNNDFSACDRCNRGRCKACLRKVKFTTYRRESEILLCGTCISSIGQRRIISQTQPQTR